MKSSLINTHCWNDIDFQEAESLLLSLNVQKITSIYEYLNIPDRQYNPTALLLFLDNGLKAVFKPNRSSRQIQAALMAYRFSQFMNFKFIPPTVTRTINDKKGVVRFFVENADELKCKFIKNLTPLEKSNIYVFYFILGEWDANKYNVLFEKVSGKPVLVDNETNTTVSFIPYGDYPFRLFKIKSQEMIISSSAEYKQFPFEEVKKINNYSMTYLKNMLHDMTEPEFNNYFIPWCFERRAFLHDGNMYFVRWNNGYWIRHNFTYYTEIFKDFLPKVFSEKTINQLKKLNYRILDSFLPDFSINKAIIYGILYRRDVLLREVLLLNSRS